MARAVMNILIDSREQRPWLFDCYGCRTSRVTLSTGDYCLPGDEYRFVIERKSASDFLLTIGSGWERFDRELDRSRSMVVIVEAPLDRFLYHVAGGRLVAPPGESTLKPGYIYKRCAEILSRAGCSLFFCESREYAERMAWSVLRGRYETTQKAPKR